MKDKIFSTLQRVGKSFMLPIAVLPIAGLLLGLGDSFTNQSTIDAYNLGSIIYKGGFLYSLLLIMSNVGNAIFGNLPIIFAMGIALGMAKKEKGVATLSAAISYFVMHTAINAMLQIDGQIVDGVIASTVLDGAIGSTVGIQSLQMGVFGGVVVGLGVAALHNKFYKIELPSAISFFGGTRFVPVISTLVYLLVGVLMFYIWQPVQNGIVGLGQFLNAAGYAGTFIYGLIKRLLIPFGLHHVFYMPFWQTAVGGTMIVDGNMVAGAQNIFFAQLASPDTIRFSVEATKYFSGEFIFMMFGLPGAALAMYQCAKPEKKKAVGGLLLSAALTSFFTGITEPIEFSFLFAAPVLFGVHAVLGGLASMIAHILNIGVGLTFSGGFIDLFLFGILQGNNKTNWIYIVLCGLVYFVLYYAVFRFLITKFNFKTPGREDDTEETKLYTKADVLERNKSKENNSSADQAETTISATILEGLGGKENVVEVDCCATRLRVTVKNGDMVKQDILKSTGASGVICKGEGVQVIYGPKVTVIKNNLEDYIDSL